MSILRNTESLNPCHCKKRIFERYSGVTVTSPSVIVHSKIHFYEELLQAIAKTHEIFPTRISRKDFKANELRSLNCTRFHSVSNPEDSIGHPVWKTIKQKKQMIIKKPSPLPGLIPSNTTYTIWTFLLDRSLHYSAMFLYSGYCFISFSFADSNFL